MAYFLVFCKAQYRFNSNYLNFGGLPQSYFGGLPQSWLLQVGCQTLAHCAENPV
jgi:hypothetical protein